MSASTLLRSATPLASIGIAALGLVPTLGGPDRPLHWAMTAGMVGFGGLLLARHRLRGAEPPLASVTSAQARSAGRTVLLLVGILTLLVLGIVVARVVHGGSIALLSWLMPSVALLWLASLGIKTLRHPPAPEVANAETERPSRRPPEWKRPGTIATGRTGSDRHVSA